MMKIKGMHWDMSEKSSWMSNFRVFLTFVKILVLSRSVKLLTTHNEVYDQTKRLRYAWHVKLVLKNKEFHALVNQIILGVTSGSVRSMLFCITACTLLVIGGMEFVWFGITLIYNILSQKYLIHGIRNFIQGIMLTVFDFSQYISQVFTQLCLGNQPVIKLVYKCPIQCIMNCHDEDSKFSVNNWLLIDHLSIAN